MSGELGEGPPTIQTSITADIRGRKYDFAVPDQSQTESVKLMLSLQEGKRSLEEFTYQQLHQHAVELMRYQMSTTFPDDDKDTWACRAFVEAQQEKIPVFTEYHDQDGNIKKAEVVMKTDSEPKISKEDLAKVESLMNTTHRGIIRQTLAEIIQRMADSQHEFGDKVTYSKDISTMYLTISQIIREEANNQTAPQEAGLPDSLKGTYKFNMDVLYTGDTVIGEKHLKWIQNPHYESLFRQKFDQTQNLIVIVENDMDRQETAWGKLATYPTWQEEAMSMAQEKDILVLGLDDQQLTNKPELFLANNITPRESLTAIFLMQITRYAKTTENPDWQEWLTTIPESYQEIAEDVLSQYHQIPNSSQKTDKIKDIINLYITLDSFFREDYYIKKIKEIKKKYSQQRLFIVVGDSHRLGIARVLMGNETRPPIIKATKESFFSAINEFLHSEKGNDKK